MATPTTALSPDPSQPVVDLTEYRQAIEEFHVMLRYALAEGLDLDDKTRQAVAVVQQNLLSLMGGVGPDHPPGPPDHPTAPPLIDFGTLMAGHAALAKAIAPATPLSLRATEPARGWMGSLRRPPLILTMIVIAILAMIGFAITSVMLASDTTNVVLEKLNWCFAAGLGAVFYVLFTAHGYVKDRTFDPRYNPLYLIRFVLGLLSGFILAIVLQSWLHPASSNTAPSVTGGTNSLNVANLGPAVIALLGGFSTEAVYQILQRIVDMLLAAIRGDDSGNAKAQVAQAAQNQLLALADDPAMPPDMKSKAIAAAKKIGA